MAASGSLPESLFDSIDVGVLILGTGRSDGRVEFANRAARELLGGANGSDFDAGCRALVAAVEGVAGAPIGSIEEGASLLVPVEGEDGHSRLRVDVRRLSGNDSARRVLLLHDVHAIESLREDLRLAQRYRTLSRIQAAAAHDMRAPLNALVLNLALVRESLKADLGKEARQRCLDSIDVMDGEFRRLDRMLQEVLLKRRDSAAQAQRVDLNRIVLRFAALLRPLCREQKVALEVDLPRGPVRVDADPDRLVQVLTNLAMNSLDAIRGGGTLVLRVVAERGRASLQVSDSGPGIPEGLMERIWDPQYSTKEHGHGLGLYVVRTIVGELGGAIGARSGPSGGTTFEVQLPLAGDASATQGAPATPPASKEKTAEWNR